MDSSCIQNKKIVLFEENVKALLVFCLTHDIYSKNRFTKKNYLNMKYKRHQSDFRVETHTYNTQNVVFFILRH